MDDVHFACTINWRRTEIFLESNKKALSAVEQLIEALGRKKDKKGEVYFEEPLKPLRIMQMVSADCSNVSLPLSVSRSLSLSLAVALCRVSCQAAVT